MIVVFCFCLSKDGDEIGLHHKLLALSAQLACAIRVGSYYYVSDDSEYDERPSADLNVGQCIALQDVALY